MKKGLALSAVVICSLASLYASGWDNPPLSEHRVGRLELPSAPAEIDSFGTYVFAFHGLTLFSYDKSNSCFVYTQDGSLFWSGTLNRNQSMVLDCPDSGLYWVSASKGITVLNGNGLLPSSLGSWFAIDPYNNPLSTKLLSMGPGTKITIYDERCVVVFSYEDSTHFKLSIPGDTVIWEQDLDSANFYVWETEGKFTKTVMVEASNPVSLMTGAATAGRWVPSFNGTFTGMDFMTYVHYEDGYQDIQVIPWLDSTNVRITEIGNPSNVIWETFCEKKGVIKGTPVNKDWKGPRSLFIHSDKDISVSEASWASIDSGSYFYSAVAVDRGGALLGKEFYLPLIRSDEYPCRLHVVSFKDDNTIKVTRISDEGAEDTVIWQGALDRGEYYEYTCPQIFEGGPKRAIYHVETSDTAVSMGSFQALIDGAAFFPMLHWEKPGGAPETPNPVTHLPSSEMEMASSIGSEIVLRYSNCPDGFHASVYDASGQKVDEIRMSKTQGIIQWGAGHGPGVYFIKMNSDQHPRKVIVVK